MALKLVYKAVRGEFAAAINAIYRPIATAATLAVKDAGKLVKDRGRAQIAAAGFSIRWQNAFRVNIYPQRGVSVNAAALAFHKIPYAGVFEDGARISGNPLLWIPLPNVPGKIGGRPMTPRAFVRAIGPLHSINRPGKPPLLAAYIAGGADAKKITVAKLRAGVRRREQRGDSAVKSVPIFFGFNAVTLKARFGLRALFERGRASLGPSYLSHIKE